MALRIYDPRPPDGGQAIEVAAGRAPRIDTLVSAPVSILDNSKPKFDVFAHALVEALAVRYGASTGLHLAKPNAAHPAPEAWYDTIRRQGGVAIAGWGD